MLVAEAVARAQVEDAIRDARVARERTHRVDDDDELAQRQLVVTIEEQVAAVVTSDGGDHVAADPRVDPDDAARLGGALVDGDHREAGLVDVAARVGEPAIRRGERCADSSARERLRAGYRKLGLPVDPATRLAADEVNGEGRHEGVVLVISGTSHATAIFIHQPGTMWCRLLGVAAEVRQQWRVRDVCQRHQA